jgi:hypothetical protein
MLTWPIPALFKRWRVRVWFLSLLFLLAAASPAGAEPCRLCSGEPGGADKETIAPVRVEVEASLDFDRVLLTAESGGAARIGADGTLATSGAVAPLTGRAMVGRVVIQGEPNRSIRIDLPNRIDLMGWHGG